MNFSFPKPSNKVTTVMVVGLLVIVTVITVDLINKNKAKNTDTTVTSEDSQSILEATSANENNIKLSRDGSFSEGDADEDGLLDWEEELRGTDKNNKDTDNDGTNDKEEVDNNRDPLKPGPDDSTLLTQDGVDIFASIAYKEGTLSDQVGQTFIENYLKIGNNNSSQLKEFSQQLASEAATIGTLEDTYSEIDFRTFPNFEEERVRKYGNLFALYYIDHKVALAKITSQTPNYAVEIDKTFNKYINRLSSLEVPRGAITMHTKFTNDTVKIKEFYNIISIGDEDPLRAYYAVGQYKIINEQTPFLLREMAIYFEEVPIIFSEEEIGIFWQKI